MIYNNMPMKRIIKILLISLGSLLLLLLIASSILLWIIFTPERLTPIVQRQADKHIPYQTEIGKVELTFFSTFPQLALRVNNITVISPSTEAPSDTLMKAGTIDCVIDARALWKDKDLIVNSFLVSDASVNLFTDSLGMSNFALLAEAFAADPEPSPDSEWMFINLEDITLKNLDVSYIDLAANIHTNIQGLHAKLKGTLDTNILNALLNVDQARVSFAFDGETYLYDNPVKLHIPVFADLGLQSFETSEAHVSINNLDFLVSGEIRNASGDEGFVTDLTYRFSSLPIEEILQMIPDQYIAFLGEFDADGKVDSEGKIAGPLSAAKLPAIDMAFRIHQGALVHEWIPFPLHRINGALDLAIEWTSPPKSSMTIRHLEARTPVSAYRTRGKMDNLFGDIYFDLLTNADVKLDELLAFIPENPGFFLKGRATGNIHSAFNLSQAMHMELEKMHLSGSANLTGLEIVYDTLLVSAPEAGLEFSLPGKGSPATRSFATTQISSKQIHVSGTDAFQASLTNASVALEMSDVRDTGRTPDVACTFNIGHISAMMDTMYVDVGSSSGLFYMFPSPEMVTRPEMKIDFTGNTLETGIGREKFKAKNLIIKTEIKNDTEQEDVFLQWLTTGFAEFTDGYVTISALPYPLEVPALKLDFDPESFQIHTSRFVLDQSDFSLSGAFNNVLSFFRGDSLLRGDFRFESVNTDLAQLMSLTSGIGIEEEEVARAATNPQSDNAGNGGQDNPGSDTPGNPSGSNKNNGFQGPYMVPQGMDIEISANVKQATFGPDTITNIIGDVRISDGILVFDRITFTTPAADMQLTAMYRTPRKNHLYLGIDYHMFDIDIGRLLDMIPDIDTLMPMLRSFEGAGEFHIAVETYLDSLYNIKKSTLRGASSIRGKDLVLMDGETFTEIAKTLRFSKKAENRVDSLSAEFTIFREEIDVYPFLIVMDRYKAVVGGRHNFDMSFNYHISVVESPLPLRFGVDVTGTMGNLRYRPTSARYAEFYRPVQRRVVENYQMELRRIIREALIKNIREQGL
ncbi:MAG: AsmA family protein [Bacteroidia bacterium]|nr:MAG: AsmA family protein [Bacteroidia bacterium]